MSALLALGTYIYVAKTFSEATLQHIRLTEYYGLYAVAYLYLALLASPLYTAFPFLPCKALYVKARPALGVCAFLFALLHAPIGFFSLLGGFNGLGFLRFQYRIAITYSTVALVLLAAMALTSNTYAREKLGTLWKKIHTLVYVAGVLIILHVLILGTHFSDLSNMLPTICIYAVLLLVILELVRLDKKYSLRLFAPETFFGPIFVIGLFLLTLTLAYLFFSGNTSFGIHPSHILPSP